MDFRRGSRGLALAVQELFGLDPFCGAVFRLAGEAGQAGQAVGLGPDGIVARSQAPRGSHFVGAQVPDGVMRMSSAQLAALFEGLDWGLVRLRLPASLQPL